MARPHTNRKRTPGLPRLGKSGALLHWLGMLAMVVGLFAPLATAEAAVTVMTPEQSLMKAAQEPLSSDTSDFQRVVLVGDFQQQLGCADWDANCGQSQLVNINGFWTGVFGVAPGAYNWELVAIDWNGAQFSIAEGQVNVADDQTGIYAEFNSATRANNVSASTGIAFANGPFGDIALAQDGDGYIANALNISTPGRVDMQVTVNGAPVQTGADFQQGTSRVTFDATGNITNVEHLGFAEITVERIDADGNPLLGSCFVLEGSSQSRACDSDGSPDGTSNGSTVLRFPGGFQPGTYTLRETRAADGAEPLADHQIDVQPGQSTIEARSEGAPAPETGDLVVMRQDDAGNPVGGACFEITNANGEVVSSACDEDGDVADDGRIGLLGVPAGDYTLSETRTPEGYDAAADMPVSVPANDVLNQPVQSAAIATDVPIETEEPTEVAPEETPVEEETEVPTEEVTEVPTDEVIATGRIIVYRTDTAGTPVGGSCFEVIDSNGQIVGDACDEDGIAADDGTTGIENVPVGDYTLVESRVPEGFEKAPDTPVTVTEGDVIYDVASDPIPATEAPTEEATEVPTEEPTEVPIETEEATAAPTEEATEAPTVVGRIVVYREDNAGNPVGGSCFEVIDADGQVVAANCDEDGIAPDDGSIGVVDVPVGDYVMVESRVPEGFEQAPDTPVTVTEGDVIYTVTSAPIPATEIPTEEATEPPTEEATEIPTEEAPTDGASIQVTFEHDESQPDVCVELESRAAIGSLEIPYACDNGENDADPAPGSIRIQSLPPGDFDLVVYDGPTELVEIEPQPVTLPEGQIVPLALAPQAPATTSFTVNVTDGTTGVAGVTFQIDETGATAESDANGVATFTDVEPDDYTVTMIGVPDGFNIADPAAQPITVAADGSSTLSFQISRATTSFTVNATDGTTGVAGVTFQIDETGATAESDANGVATFPDVEPDDYTVTMTGVPDGFDLSDPASQPITVAADGSSSLDFQISRATTSFTVNVTDGTTGVAGVTFQIDETGATAESDANGVATFTDVEPDDYTITMTGVPDGFNFADPVSQSITVLGDGSSTLNFQITAITVDIVVSTVNQDTGEPLEGACYTLNGGEVTCEQDVVGQVVFPNQTPGDQNLSMETAPAGFEPASDQVIPSGTTTVEVGLRQATGTIQISIVDDMTDEPVVGACAQLGSEDPVCDDADGTDDGIVNVVSPIGDQQVRLFSVPATHQLPDEANQVQQVTVESGVVTSIEFRVSETPPTTGNLDVTVLFAGDDEAPVADACLIATMEEGDITETACDDNGDGIVNFVDIQSGAYLVTLDTDQYDGPAIEDVTPVSANVPEGSTGTASLYLTQLPTTGTLEITTVANGSNVPGACFTVGTQIVCDDEGGDANTTPGVVSITGIEPNDNLVVNMSTVPPGYQQPADQTVSITAGETTSIQFTLEATILPGSVTVRTLDGNGDPLNGACYRLVQGATVVGPLCDSEPADSDVLFEDVPAGDYRLEQTTRPSNQFETPSPQSITVSPEENTLVEIEMSQRPGQLRITTVDAEDTSSVLEGACYRILGEPGFGPFCDADDGNSDGIVRFTNLPAGEYELEQTVSTAGFDPAANRTVVITPGGSTQITILNARVQPPAETGTLVVIPLDPNGNAVAGGCYQVFDGNNPVTHRVCDNADDQPARITFENLPVGDLTLREMLAPSPDWQIAADIPVTIINGETTTVEVPHEFKHGNVVIQAVNTVGLPLQGACFTLSDAGDTELCTDSTGQATVTGLAPGTRELIQTQAPFGFELNETPREVIVRPGQTTTVRVVFENAPPPNTGTVQVQKFFCPAGEEGERTRFLGGAQGNQELQQTAGCTPGVASFTLVAEDGSTESNAEFSTNEDGRAQLTAVEGIYLLTETNPDMPGNSSARLRVGVGQMTTVIVINYVAPPAPAPVTINVEGYTCAPGFNGSSFVDFQTSCMAESQLTNQITVRAEAEARYKRSTGDTGVLGKTSFVDLPAGTYTIWAERPHTVPVSYMFCGADVNNPTMKTVNGSMRITLESGSTILCRVFQVPPLFDAEHGAIQVQKFNCPIDERQRGYDFQNECERATEPIPFEIVQLAKTDGTPPEPVRVSTNADGIVQFPMLVPGTYKLTEVDSEWCFAQSNSVDANGDVVVQKNKLSEVWVYNCVGTKSPPNTGSGDAAGLSGPDGGISPMSVLPNLIWPTVLLAGWMIWRERKQA